MTALTPPPNDAPAAEWGRLAVSIPGWRWPDSCPLSGFFRKAPDASWGRVDNIELFAWGEGECIPDPDHWAWEGWLLRMLGDERWRLHLDDVGEWSFWVNGPPQTHGTGHLIHVGESLGRACICVAAGLVRWPGDER